jgi:hypothetical protein
MLVCDEHKFVFLRNPKTASRSVTKALAEKFDCRTVGIYHDWKIPEELTGHFIFTVVRNPYVRAVSGWKHWSRGQGVDFNEWTQRFVRPLNKVIFPKGKHWKRQTEILDKISSDVHLIRYENLEEDLNSLSFIDNIVLPSIGVQDYGDWRTHYTPEIEARVYRACREDFYRLGYKRWHFDKGQIALL